MTPTHQIPSGGNVTSKSASSKWLDKPANTAQKLAAIVVIVVMFASIITWGSSLATTAYVDSNLKLKADKVVVDNLVKQSDTQAIKQATIEQRLSSIEFLLQENRTDLKALLKRK